MSDQIITCPKCETQIPLTDALTGEIREQLKSKIEKDVKEREKQLALDKKALQESQKNIDEQVNNRLNVEKAKFLLAAKEEASKKFELEMKDLKKANHEKEKQIEEMRKQELNLRQKARELETKEKNMELEFNRKMDEATKKIDKQVTEKLNAEKTKILAIAEEEAGKKVELEMQNLKKADEDKEKQLEEMRKQAIASMNKAREFETKDKNRELEFNRKMNEAAKKIEEQAKREADEANKMKSAEKDKQMEQMRKTIEELKRKSEQGSTQIQGDAQEEALKEILQGMFPIDRIEDVPTGVKGADLVHTVNNSLGQKAGMILWESKNTQKWDNKWIAKLKDDQALVKADVCILVSQSLPEGLENFGLKDGVWVCSYKFALSLTGVLRLNLIQIGQIKQSLVGKDQKMELLYNYLSGSEFGNRVGNIVSAFISMKADLETEKRSMQRIWNKREKEIDRVRDNTSCMYGDLQGIVGASLPTIESLMLPSGEDE